MFINGKRNKSFKLGMCYFADDVNGGGAGTDPNPNPETKQEDAKFTQEDLNKLISERLATEKENHKKEMEEFKNELEKKAKLEKMSENDRVKAELEDYKNQLQAEKDKNALALQTEETRKLLEAEKLPTAFVDFVLVPKDEVKTSLNIKNLKNVFDAEVKKGVEAQIKPHNPTKNVNIQQGNERKHNGPTYSGLSLQNAVADYYNN